MSPGPAIPHRCRTSRAGQKAARNVSNQKPFGKTRSRRSRGAPRGRTVSAAMRPDSCRGVDWRAPALVSVHVSRLYSCPLADSTLSCRRAGVSAARTAVVFDFERLWPVVV